MPSPIFFTIDVKGTDFYIQPEIYRDKCIGMTPHCLIYRQDGSLYNIVYLTPSMDFVWSTSDIGLLELRTIQKCIKDNWGRLNEAFRVNKDVGF